MQCKNCGGYVDENSMFCPNCGARQDQPQQQTGPRTVNGVAMDQPAGKSLPSVGFLDAMKLFFQNYTEFSTRSRRSEFWWAYLGITIVSQLISVIAMNVGGLSWLASLWSMAILVPSISICVRRLHDVGRSGLFYLWILLPLVGWIILLIQFCKDSEGENQWGPNPKTGY